MKEKTKLSTSGSLSINWHSSVKNTNDNKLIVKIEYLRPNKWFLNRSKLEKIREKWKIEEQHLLPPPLITEIDGGLALVDGHCRVLVAWENGLREIEVEFRDIDDFNGLQKLYERFHRLGPKVGVKTIVDLRVE